MSSVEESDDEFESADEEIDFETTSKPEDRHRLTETNDKANTIAEEVPQFKDKLKISEEIKIDSDVKENKTIDSLNEKEMNLKLDENLIKKTDENKAKEVKTSIKGRKIMRKADRLRDQTTNEISDLLEQKKSEVSESSESFRREENINENVIKNDENRDKDSKNEIDLESDENKTMAESKDKDMTEESDMKSDEIEVKTTDENKAKDEKTTIKGRKLMRKVDRLRDQTPDEDSEILEQKKSEVLNKLSDLSESSNTSKWNNWFSDIRSAAVTATSTTVSHVSQASNKWSFDPKSLLSSAATITTSVGSGLSTVVDNVASVMDTAIGAPPPEQMAALVNKDNTPEPTETNEEHKVNANTEPKDKPTNSGFGFGLFDYTLNTLESIGKKTMEVIVDDSKKTDKR